MISLFADYQFIGSPCTIFRKEAYQVYAGSQVCYR